MQAEIICIGDELLIGQVVNTNAAWLSRALADVGLQVTRTVCVADHLAEIEQAIREAMDRVSWIFMTGGLGPTKDDMTKHALVKTFGGEMQFSQETWEHLVKIYARFDKVATDAHREQAMIPSLATILFNKMGTAPGLYFNTNDARVFAMPGVPYEMEFLMGQHILPLIRTYNNRDNVVYRTLATVGEGETFLADRITDIEEALPDHIHLAYLPSPGRVRLRVTGMSDDPDLVQQVESVTAQILERIAQYVYATEDIPLADAIGRTLRAHGRTLTVAESCTGGYLGHLITAIPASSDYFVGGAITYSNQMKMQLLGVKQETLDKHGAVSEETVREMSTGARTHFAADYAIAISGVAGPTGGTTEKPVGTVWVSVATPNVVVARRFLFTKDRLRNIELSAIHALNLLRMQL